METFGVVVSMETFAVVVSVLALVVAIAGLLLSWRAYRRSGARVRIRALRQAWTTPAANESARARIAVDVRNSGQSEIQVAAANLEILGTDESVPLAGPGVLRGLSTGTWFTYGSDVLQAAGVALDTGGKVRYRAHVTLGNGKTVRSRWCTHTVPPDPGRL